MSKREGWPGIRTSPGFLSLGCYVDDDNDDSDGAYGDDGSDGGDDDDELSHMTLIAEGIYRGHPLYLVASLLPDSFLKYA